MLNTDEVWSHLISTPCLPEFTPHCYTINYRMAGWPDGQKPWTLCEMHVAGKKDHISPYSCKYTEIM